MEAPPSILIIGSGVFGLSAAFAFANRPRYSSTTITLLDRSPTIPAPDASSTDSSRIVRSDYASLPYAHLAARAQALWRSTPGLKDSYSQSGLVLFADAGTVGEKYVRESHQNVLSLNSASGSDSAGAVLELPTRQSIAEAGGTGSGTGDWGYMNKESGWADAEKAMRWLRSQVEATGRVVFKHGTATSILHSGRTVTGALLSSGETISAALVIAACGAWTPSLIDLRGRASASGQVLAYLSITPEEEAQLKDMRIQLNMSNGMFVIPPRDGILKVARHGYGYTNPVEIASPLPSSACLSTPPLPSHPPSSPKSAKGIPPATVQVSVPRTAHSDPALSIPDEGAQACAAFLAATVPSLFTSNSARPFARTRICWYTDTPAGDFLITYHPEYSGLFLATGGSGHGFKFLPVIGDAIVDCVEGKMELASVKGLREKWGWRAEAVGGNGGVVVTEDGTRGGRKGMLLDEEMTR